MNKEWIYAGLMGGIIFGVMQSLAMGFPAGLFQGLFFGVGLGLFLCVFANSKAIKNQTSVPEAALLPGERILLTKPANLVVEPKHFGLENFAFDDLLWTVGMKDKESLGGAVPPDELSNHLQESPYQPATRDDQHLSADDSAVGESDCDADLPKTRCHDSIRARDVCDR